MTKTFAIASYSDECWDSLTLDIVNVDSELDVLIWFVQDRGFLTEELTEPSNDQHALYLTKEWLDNNVGTTVDDIYEWLYQDYRIIFEIKEVYGG